MKKILLLSTFYFLLSTMVAFGYTSVDVSNATFLANENLIVKQSTNAKYRLDDTITRAEVVGIALKIKGIELPTNYTCKNYFSDVRFVPFSNDQWICRAVELSADNDLVTRSNATFRPQDKVTKAEALAIIMQSNYHIPSGAPIQPFIDVGVGVSGSGKEYWIIDLVNFAHIQGVIQGDENKKTSFYPSRSATRAEVMGYAKKVFELRQQEQANGKTLKIENKNVVLYENGIKIRNLTDDGNMTAEEVESCTSGQQIINYSLLYQSIINTVTYAYIIKSGGICEGGGNGSALIFDGYTLQDMGTLIKNTYAITIGNGMGEDAYIMTDSLKDGRIIVRGTFFYDGDCDLLYCSEIFSHNRIAELRSKGLKVLQEPRDDIPGIFEFEMSAMTLTTY